MDGRSKKPPETDPHKEADKNLTPDADLTESNTVELTMEARMNNAFSEMRQAMEEFHLSTQAQINVITEKRRRSDSADFDAADQALKCRIDAINDTTSPSGEELELTSQNLQERIDVINQKTNNYFRFAGQVLQHRTNTNRLLEIDNDAKPSPNTPNPDDDAIQATEETGCGADGEHSPLLRGGESPRYVPDDVLILDAPPDASEDTSASDEDEDKDKTEDKKATSTSDAKKPNQIKRQVNRRVKELKQEYATAKDDLNRTFKSWKKELDSFKKVNKREVEIAKQDLKRGFERQNKKMKEGLSKLKMGWNKLLAGKL